MQQSGRRKDAPILNEVSKRLDLTHYIDYLLLNYYGGNGDWGERKNWYAIRRRADGERFRYYVWDGEMILQGIRDDAVNSPGRPPFNLARRLKTDPEFLLAFADRVQRHCFGSGALTPASSIERWQRRATELQVAIVAESARWGYYHRDVPFTRDREWMTEQRRLVDHYFPRRTKVLLKQLQTAGLYPLVEAPRVLVTPGAAGQARQLALEGAEGSTLYFTLDGSDPRESGSSKPSDQAKTFQGAMTLAGSGIVKVRARLGETWSALVETIF